MPMGPQSMTGVGLAAGPCELGDLRVEVRTTNGRGFQARLRLPACCAPFEAAIEQCVRAAVRRGSALVIVERSGERAGLPDAAALREVASALQALAKDLGLPPPTVADVVQAAAAAARVEPAASRPLPPRLRALLTQALDELLADRAAGGRETARAIEDQLRALEAGIAGIVARAPQLVAEHERRLLLRVQELAKVHLVEPPPAFDLVREVAAFADRIDVAEELQRLRAHAAELRATLSRPGEIGRRLEFLLQELLRETNTAGAKSPDTAVAHHVVAMKGCIERMKEQAANLL